MPLWIDTYDNTIKVVGALFYALFNEWKREIAIEIPRESEREKLGEWDKKWKRKRERERERERAALNAYQLCIPMLYILNGISNKTLIAF